MIRAFAFAGLLSVTAAIGAQDAPSAGRPSSGFVPLEQLLRSVPPPPGTVALRERAPELFEDVANHPDSRLVEMYVTPKDAEAYEAGEPAEMLRYYSVNVPRPFDGRPATDGDVATLPSVLDDRVAAAYGMDGLLSIHRREPWGVFGTYRHPEPDDAGSEGQPLAEYAGVGLVRLGGQIVELSAVARGAETDALHTARSSLDAWANALHAADPVRPRSVGPAQIHRNSLAWPLIVLVVSFVLFAIARRSRTPRSGTPAT